MSQTLIDNSTGTSETIQQAFSAVNANDAELYGAKTEVYANFAAFPATGLSGKIYIATDTGIMYRWTGAAYDDLTAIQFVANAAALPVTGEALKEYVALDTNARYRWTGSAYVLTALGATTDASGNTALAGADGVPIPLNPTLRNVGYENEQPAAIIAPVTNFGKIVARFSGSVWTATAGVPTLTQGYTGWDGAGAKTGIVSRTGQPSMLKVVPAANTTEQIELGTPGTNILNAALAGKFGLWVYVESQPGYQVGGTLAGSIGVTISTNAASAANALNVSFNSNQIREGWNFLKFVQRQPTAYQAASGVTEYHPYGINASAYGTGADSNIVASNAAKVQIYWSNMLGATLYFDSLWTGFASTAQVVLGCDGGVGFQTYALPVFDSYGWVGYTAYPFNVLDSGTGNLTYQSNLTTWATSDITAAYSRGWDVINHTVTHPSVGSYTAEANIAWQIQQARAYMLDAGFIRGSEFYASPQSSSSRLSESVIKTVGVKLQRHARKFNVSPTQFGIDNPQHVGAIDMGNASSNGVTSVVSGATVTTGLSGMQIASKIKRTVDLAVAYGDTIFPFWHGITTTGDTGTGEDLTGDNLLLTKSAFEISMAYIKQLETAGSLTVRKGMTGFWYGGRA